MATIVAIRLQRLNGLHLTPSSSVGEMTSCELYDQTVFCSRAGYLILLRVPLAFCLVHAVPLYVKVKITEIDVQCQLLHEGTFVVSQTSFLCTCRG
jgi:hypothetical protein